MRRYLANLAVYAGKVDITDSLSYSERDVRSRYNKYDTAKSATSSSSRLTTTDNGSIIRICLIGDCLMQWHDRFEWDELKAEANLHKHGITFDQAAEVLNG